MTDWISVKDRLPKVQGELLFKINWLNLETGVIAHILKELTNPKKES